MCACEINYKTWFYKVFIFVQSLIITGNCLLTESTIKTNRKLPSFNIRMQFSLVYYKKVVYAFKYRTICLYKRKFISWFSNRFENNIKYCKTGISLCALAAVFVLFAVGNSWSVTYGVVHSMSAINRHQFNDCSNCQLNS